MPWLWNTQLTNALMIGLGGASTQRAYQHYYPDLSIETAELDPVVVRVAKDYFRFQESATQRVQVSDGRVFLRRGGGPYGVIILDAYEKNRYGSFIPYHLATRAAAGKAQAARRGAKAMDTQDNKQAGGRLDDTRSR